MRTLSISNYVFIHHLLFFLIMNKFTTDFLGESFKDIIFGHHTQLKCLSTVYGPPFRDLRFSQPLQ